MRPGELSEPVTVLELQEAEGIFRWEPLKTAWAKAEVSGKTNLFSKVGLGASSVAFTLHRQALTLHHAIAWRGRHCFLTDIKEEGLVFLTVEAAMVELSDCMAEAGEEPPGCRFPGVLTEKYLRHEQLTPMAENTFCHVLVTPKAIALRHGSLVEVSGAPYEVLLGHTLDPHKNEYEILRKGEP